MSWGSSDHDHSDLSRAIDETRWDAAWAAARAAAGDALKPTVELLQESAFELLGRLCDAGRVEVTA